MKIGVVGAGTIGHSLIDHILSREDAQLVFVLCRPGSQRHMGAGADVFTSDVDDALGRDVDLVVEAANPAVLADLAPRFLKSASVCGFSCTALSDPQTEATIRKVADESGTSFYVPHGAILGLDGIFDGRAGIDSITITTTKSGTSLGRAADAEGVLFEGSTRAACAVFPRNVNVHAAVALAGLGFDKTVSRIVAVPGQRTMEHRIDVEGPGLSWSINVSSQSLGGVTGAYTPLSALGSLERILSSASMKIV